MWPLYILEIDYEKSLLCLPLVLCGKKDKNLEERMAIQNPRFSKHVEGALLFLRVSCGYYFLMVFLTVTLDRLSERGTTCSLIQKGFQQFSPHNALVLEEIIIN